MDAELQTRIAAEDYLEALAAQGIDYLFANPGTDFAPIVEAFTRAERTNRVVPRLLVVPHENAAVWSRAACWPRRWAPPWCGVPRRTWR